MIPCNKDWISYDAWIWPWTTWIGVLLSPSTWTSVKSTCTAAFNQFLIVVASATKINVISNLNVAVSINLPPQLWMTWPPHSPRGVLDPSKLFWWTPLVVSFMLSNESSYNWRLNDLGLIVVLLVWVYVLFIIWRLVFFLLLLMYFLE